MANPIISGNWKYTVNNGKATIVEYTGPGSAVTVPTALDGITVNKIGDAVFFGRSDITSVSFSSGITEFGLGDYVFAYSGITSLSVPNGVQELSGTCLGCTSLASISIPSTVKKLTHSAFCGCTSLSGTLSIPMGVTDIGYKSFCGCTSLTTVIILNNVVNIWESAFEGCTSVHMIVITDNVERIAYKAFYNCSSLTTVRWFSNKCKSIDASAFAFCSSLNEIGNIIGPVRIGRHAFYECGSNLVISLSNSTSNVIVSFDSPELISEMSIDSYEETSGYVYDIAHQLDSNSKVYKIRLVKNGQVYELPSSNTVNVALLNPFNDNLHTLYKYTDLAILNVSASLIDTYYKWTTDLTDSTDFILSNVDISLKFGDINLDGLLNLMDLSMLSSYLDNPYTMPVKSIIAADLDHDGQITQADYQILRRRISRNDQ